MKLPDIQYRPVATPRSTSPAAAWGDYQGKQQVLQAGQQLAETVAVEQVRYQTANANAGFRDRVIELQTALAGRDELTRDELITLGASETNPGINWQDGNGEPRETLNCFYLPPVAPVAQRSTNSSPPLPTSRTWPHRAAMAP